ncbi:imidazolonepropionase [Posidoniimonas polymericola]|uniref:Imidazolonepropionase n=1 Tax=Posidoniimonas polymericola TaxID=2528002 RepID=A0A5C5YTB2_9BACT|nr:amidohydrolase family protein [Posidoniimonas polymericola]TWT78219.1 imidazolonepropionase [Posidoniimonas polymericola]
MKSACLLVLLTLASSAPGVWGADQSVALVGATLHPVSSAPIENGVLVIRDGKIAALGNAGAAVGDAERVDLAGKHIYPSLISAYTQLGLVEIDAVRATRDFDEAGTVNPNAHAHKAFNPHSELIPVTRSNGVLLALTAPEGGRIPGCSSLMQLAGWTFEDMLVEPDVGLHMHWPRERPRDDDHGDDHDAEDHDEQDEVEKLALLFDQAKAYHALRAESKEPPAEVDLRLEALGPVLRGERPVIVVATDGQAEIEAAVAFCVARGLRMILHGGYDAPLCADLLIEHDIPVILSGVTRLPLRRNDPYHYAYSLPARLQAAGVRYCIAGSGNDAGSNARNLPYHAGTAAAFGLTPEEALRSITLSPAEILAVADRVGSLEPGKHATLFVADGDPLDIATQVERAYVQGREVDLNDRHKQLYKKFKQRLEE